MNVCSECGENVVVEKAGTFHVRDPHDPAATADHEAVTRRVRLIPVLNKREREFGARHPATALGKWSREQDGAARCSSEWCGATSGLSTRIRYTTSRVIRDTYCARCWADIDEADRVMGTGDPMERAR